MDQSNDRDALELRLCEATERMAKMMLVAKRSGLLKGHGRGLVVEILALVKRLEASLEGAPTDAYIETTLAEFDRAFPALLAAIDAGDRKIS